MDKNTAKYTCSRCVVGGKGWIEMCTFHAGTPDLLEALKPFAQEPNENDNMVMYPASTHQCTWCSGPVRPIATELWHYDGCPVIKARAAIAQVEPSGR